jgi:hypothetical protein
VPPFDFPESPFVKGRGQGQQHLADQVKEKPGSQQPQQEASEGESVYPARPFQQRQPGQRPEAIGTDHLIVMFRNAFPTKVLAAAGTTRRRLTLDVIEATQLRQVLDHTWF